MNPIETHPLAPFFPPGAKVLICGTFPPQQKRWSMHFYYPNYINDFWRIIGIIFRGDKDAFVDVAGKTFYLDEIKKLLSDVGIAMSDTGKEVIRTRDNASDKFLEIVTPINIKEALEKLPQCRGIVTTGEKAASVIASQTGSEIPKTGEYVEIKNPASNAVHSVIRHWRMPSTSRAYPLPLVKKADAYKKMFEQAGLIKNTD